LYSVEVFDILVTLMDNDKQNKAFTSIYGVSFDKQAQNGDVFQATFQPRTDNWSDQAEEGQLAVDIFDTKTEIIVISTMSGAEQENLDIMIHNDLLTIRGSRKSPGEQFLRSGEVIEFFHNECFWGKFSRTIVLPHDVKSELTNATLQNGVLMIRLPKVQEKSTRIPITVIEE